MITTDAIYNTLIASGSYEEGVTGTLKDGSGATVLNISNEYIKTGSLIIDNKCINNDDLEPGAVYAAELKITITGNAGLTSSQKSSLQNGSLNLTYTITDGNSSSSIPIGIYYIIEVTLKDEDVEIIAEDMMSRLSKNIPTAVREDLNFVARTPYELLDLCCQNCSTSRRPISLANDETEFDGWSNADASFLIPVTADIATYRDLVAEVAKIMGCFATIDKNTNGLILKRLNPHSNSNVWNLNEDIRYRTEKSGYICRFGKVALGNESYPDTSDEDVSGLILNMRATELTDDSELLPGVVQNLYTEFSGISYRPCKIDFMGNIALEVGDWIGVNYTEDGTTYTFRTIITHLNWILNGKELIESTGSSAATTKKVGSKGSSESRNSSSIDNLESRIETIESSGGGGNKIYTSKSAPDNTLGNEGDLWVKYHTENNDKFINSNNEEIDVDIPRYESDNDALSYVDTTIRPILRTIKDTSASQLSDIVKQFEKECTVTLYQTGTGMITSSQFPQLVIDTYTVNNQSLSVIQGNNIVTISETAVTSRVIGSSAYNNLKYVNVDDFDNALVEDRGNWYVYYSYLYYNTTTKYLNVVTGYLNINWYYHTLPSDNLNFIVTNYSINLSDVSFEVIDEVYCKINGKWTLYDESGSGGSAVNTTYDNTTSGLSASNVQSAIDEIAQDFQDGCDIITQAVTAKGQTPASNSPSDIAYAISRIPTDYPRLQKVYSVYTDPIETTIITDTGQYFVIAVMTSKPGVTTSSTDIVYFNGETTGRQTAVYIINCKAGDTISIKMNNFSGNAYRGTAACILRNVGATVTSAVQDWKVFKFDSTATMGKVLSLNTIYLCVGGSCGEQHSSSFNVTANLGSYYNSNCQESDINVSVINALSGTVNISQSQFGNIAGGATVSGYILTV